MKSFRIVDTRFRILKGGKIGLAMSVAMIGGMLTLGSTSANAYVLASGGSATPGTLDMGYSGGTSTTSYDIQTQNIDALGLTNTHYETDPNTYWNGSSWVGAGTNDYFNRTDTFNHTITLEAGKNITGRTVDSTQLAIYSKDYYTSASDGWGGTDSTYTSTRLTNGTLNIQGNNQIYGIVGANVNSSGFYTGVDALSTINLNGTGVYFGDAVNASTININSGTNNTNTNDYVFNGVANTANMNFSQASSVLLNGGLTGNLNFNGYNSTVTVGSNQTIGGNITTSGINGTLIFQGAGIVTGDIGTGPSESLAEIRLNGTGTVSLNNTLSANVDYVNYKAAATLNAVGGLLMNVDTSNVAMNQVAFNNHDGVLNIGNNADLTGIVGKDVVTTSGISKGTVTMQSGSQTITGNIGTDANKIKTLNIGDSASDNYSVTTANGNIYATNTVLNNLSTTNGSELRMESGYNLHSTVTTVDANMGALKLLGANQIVTGNVGTTGTRLAEVDSGANGATSNFGTAQATTDVFAVTVNNTGTGTTNFSHDVGATTINVANGTSNFANNVTATTTTISDGIANFNTNGTGTTTSNIIFSGVTGQQSANVYADHGLTSTTAIANLHTGLTGNIYFDDTTTQYDTTVNVWNGKSITGNILDRVDAHYGYVNFRGNGSVGGNVAIYGLNIGTIEQGTVTFNGNVSARDNVLLLNDSEMVMASGTNIGVNTIRSEWTDIGTRVANTGTLTMAGGTQVVDGNVGTSNKSLKLVNAGATAGTTTFDGMVYATTLNYLGNGTVVLNQGMVGIVDFGTGGIGALQIGNGLNLTSGINGIQFANANAATMVFNGDATVTGVVGGNTAGQSTLAEIHAGVAGKTVTFTDDVHVMEGALNPATFYVSGTGTVNFQGNLSGGLVYNADGVVNVSNTKSIIVSTVPVAVTTLVNGTGTLNYLGSTTLDTDIGTSALKLKSVTFNKSTNNVTQEINKNVYANTVTIGGSAGTSAISLNAVPGTFDYTGATQMFTYSGGTTANISNVGNTGAIALGGDLVIANATTAVNFGTAHANVGGNMVTTNGAMSFTVNTNDITTNAAASTSTGSGQVNVTGNLTMSGAEKVHVNYVGSLANSGTYNLINSAAGTTVNATVNTVVAGAYNQNESGAKVTDNSFSIDTRVATNAAGDLIAYADRTGAASGTAYTANQNYVYKSDTLGNFSNNAAIVLGGIAAAGNQTGDMVQVIQKLDIDSFGYGNTAANLAVQAKRLAPAVNASLSQSQMGANTLVLNTVSNRITDLRGDSSILPRGITGISAGDEEVKNGGWVKVIGSTARQEKDGQYDGYKTTSTGIAMGLDRKFGYDIIAGLAFGYTNTNVKQEDFRLGDNAQTHSYQVIGYASKNFENVYVDGALSYARHYTDSTRATAVGRVASANIDTNQYSGRLGTGYRFNVKDKATITPFLSVDYTHLGQDGYTETGAGAINLAVDKVNTNRTTLGGGLRFGTQIEKGSIVFRPELRLAAYNYMGGNNTDVMAQYTGGGEKFVTPGKSLDHKTYNVGLGLKTEITKLSSVGVNIDYDRSSDGLFQGYTGQLIGRIEF